MAKNGRKALLLRARRGEIPAQREVADALMSGESTRAYRRALPWLRIAAKCGDRWAEYHLGLIYDHGLTGRRDLRRAVQWYGRSAAKGYSRNSGDTIRNS
jgi:uncharacterized protein